MSLPNPKAIVSASSDNEVKTKTTASTTSKDASGDKHETKTADDKVKIKTVQQGQ